MKKKLLLLFLLPSISLHGYKYTVTNLTPDDLTLTTNMHRGGGWAGAMTSYLNPAAAGGAACLVWDEKKFSIKRHSKISFDTVYCLLTTLWIEEGGKQLTSYAYEYGKVQTYEANTASFDIPQTGADLYIHKTNDIKKYEINQSKDLTVEDLKYSVSQAALKESQEMDKQAASRNISLKFMANKPADRVGDAKIKQLKAQEEKTKSADDQGMGQLHKLVKTQKNFQEINPATLESAEDMVISGLLESKTKYNDTPLIYAAMDGKRDWVLFFVRHRADVAAKNNAGKNSLHYAAEFGDPYIVLLLIKAAQMLAQEKKLNGTLEQFINAKDNKGQTPFDLAAVPEVIRLFMDMEKIAGVKAKLDVNTLNKDGVNKLHLAATDIKNGDILDYLFSQQSTNKYLKSKDGLTAIHMSVIVDKAFKDAKLKGKSPFEKFFDAGANFIITDEKGNNPLHVAAAVNDKDVIAKILSKFKDLINSTNNDGNTPLHIAVMAHARNATEKLVELGAKQDAKNKANKTPLEIAAEKDFQDLTTFLKNPKDGMPVPYETKEEKKAKEDAKKAKK